MTRIVKEIEINASPRKIWTLITKHLEYPEYVEEQAKGAIKSAKGEAISKKRKGTGVTTRWTYEFKGRQYSWDDIVTEWVENQKIVWKATSRWNMVDSFTLIPTEKGTKLIYDMDYKLPYWILGWIYNKLTLQKHIEENLENTLKHIKRTAERLPGR